MDSEAPQSMTALQWTTSGAALAMRFPTPLSVVETEDGKLTKTVAGTSFTSGTTRTGWANLFQEGSSLRCVLITQGGLLRQLCHSYSHLSNFIKKVRLAFNDESQQGGKAGFTVIGAHLPCTCLQCLTGDQEQTKAGTGGEKLQEALADQLAHKACSRPFAMPRLQVFLLIEILPSTSSNTSVVPPCPSRASPLLFGKPKGWCPLQGSPYTSSSHTPSDVLPTLTSPRWLCTTHIYNTIRLWTNRCLWSL